jgi:hypothetical protein
MIFVVSRSPPAAAFGLLTLVVALGCGASTIVEDDASTTSTSGTSTGGAASGSTSSSGAASGSGGFNTGTGGVMTLPWENDCGMTGIAIDSGVGPVAVLDRACPNDMWSMAHYDGATAYDVAGGVVSHLDFRACDASGEQRIWLSGMVNGIGAVTLTGGQFQEAPGVSYTLNTGTMAVTNDVDIGQVLNGNYDGSFNPDQNDGPPIALSGEVGACILPTLALP